MTAKEVITHLKLSPLDVEGGYFRRRYENDLPHLAARTYGIDSESTRSVCTAIYYLVDTESFSALHRVKSDEIFHFYGGDPAEMIQIDAQGKMEKFILGNDLANGHLPQILVRRGVWQGLRLKEGGRWSLMGTTVAPGFEYEDFELGDRAKLLSEFPQFREEIIRFTRATL